MDVRSAGLARSHRRRNRLVKLAVAAAIVVAVVASIASFAWAATSSFPDVPITHPYYAAITDLASRGVIGGYANGDFGPDDPVTRQQFAKMIVLAGGYPVSETDVCPFTDVEKGDASTLFPDNFIAVCAAKGITNGTSPTTFNPSGKITRYQVVSMVVRMADNLQSGLLAPPPAIWSGNVAWTGDPVHGANAARAEYNVLLGGLDLAALSPTGAMSRGEVALVLHNLVAKIAPEPTTTTSGATTSTTTPVTSSSTTTSSTTTTTEGPRKWVEIDVAGSVPPSRGNQAMVYAGTTGKVIMFGGEDLFRYFKDIWSFDPATRTWTDLTPSGTLPTGRVGCALAYDPATNKVILFGGVAGDDYETYFNDTWSFDVASRTWTNLMPGDEVPSPRAGHCMEYDPATHKIVLFGGVGPVSAQNDTWAYDPATNTWTSLYPSGDVPPAREQASMVYDKAAGKMILFGGIGDGDVFDDQTWAYDPVAVKWQNLHATGSPLGRAGHSMAYDEAEGTTILFGGMQISGADLLVLYDTWAYNSAANTWTNLKPAGDVPPPRGGHTMVYDLVSRKTILFGGAFLILYLGDIWSFGH
jgi:N-acetylneuraminic acid mutarotase